MGHLYVPHSNLLHLNHLSATTSLFIFPQKLGNPNNNDHLDGPQLLPTGHLWPFIIVISTPLAIQITNSLELYTDNQFRAIPLLKLN